MHPSPRSRRRWRPVWHLSMLALALTACGRSATPMDPAQGRVSESSTQAAAHDAAAALNARQGFYPLEVGNRWSYEHTIAIFTIPVGGPPGPVFGSSDRRDRVLVCVEQRAGGSYVVEQNGVPATPAWWLRYRQDGAGLYEMDGDVTLPPTCSGTTGTRAFVSGARPGQPGEASWKALAATLPGPEAQAAYRAGWDRLQARAAAIRQVIGAAPRVRAGASLEGVELGELTRLAYPLHPGAHWVIRDSPRFESTVEAPESLDLPPGRMHAWRIRIDSEFLGPNDHVHVWYGRNGLLKSASHFEGVATDAEGNVIGTVVANETEDLLELSLGGRLPTP